jgi:nucleoside-triphosphatase THEP1
VKKILIYTGPVQSGKSSRLLSFIQGRNDVGGILSLLIGGKKYLFDISSGDKRILEADLQDKVDDVIVVGRYKFKKKIFDWGREVLKKASEENHTYLIIDEIGQLEFEGKGLSPVADEIIIKNISSVPNVLVVVRETLLNKFLEHYNLGIQDIEFFHFE